MYIFRNSFIFYGVYMDKEHSCAGWTHIKARVRVTMIGICYLVVVYVHQRARRRAREKRERAQEPEGEPLMVWPLRLGQDFNALED
jgi:hypothetical protein